MATVGRVERRFAHQAVHAGFGAQESVGVIAFDLEGCGLDARDFAVGLFHDFDLETLALAIAQVLAQQHRCPVLRFGAAGAGLDIDEAVVGIHRIGKHPAEFHVFDQFFQVVGVLFDGQQRVIILLFARHLKQVVGVAQAGVDFGQRVDNRFQRLLFLAEFLRAFRIVPDGGVFQFLVDLFEFLRLRIEVKDTSVIRLRGSSGRRAGRRGS